MRLIGLDVGERRIGIASGDTESSLALPAGAIERTESDADIAAILSEAASRDAVTLVVGMPLSMNGRRGPQAESVEAFVDRLRAATDLAVVTVDERLSTVEASRRMQEGRAKKGRGERGDVDAAAAAVILQSYMDGQRQPPRRNVRGPDSA